MTWELFADIVNAIVLFSAFFIVGAVIYIYIDNTRKRKK